MSFKDKKRVTVRLKCPNPLFEEWLIGWKEEAMAKDSKMQYIFSHALQSLRKYPLPFQSGRDCKILKGFGDKLCKMLDEKLKEYKKSNGAINIVNNDLHITTSINIEKTIAKNSNKQDSDTRSKRNGSTIKQYIPQYGSGSYAILVSLYTQSLQSNYPGFLSKAQVIEHGKCLVNTSFTKPDPGTRYTAWSSMKTLISKNLVSRISHPPKFSLTHEGQQLARKLYENSDDNKSNNMKKNGCDIISFGDLVNSEYLGEKCTSDKVVSPTSKENKNANITVTNNCKLYDVDIPDEFTDELIRNSWIPENDTFSSGTNNVKNIDSMDLGIKDKYIQKYDAAFVNTNTARSYLNNRPGTSKELVNSVQCIESSRQAIQYDKLLSGRSLSSKEDSSENLCPKEVGTSTFHKFYSADSVSSVQSFTDIPTKNKNSSKNALNRIASSSSVTSTTSTVVDNFVMASNSFDIILYVDNNETSGSSNNLNDAILVNLTRQGIKHEVKDLKVGDFLWICRDKITKKELVLPYIVERKRMDDLAKSIKDRRYQEQKFRLKKSGVENLIYLVESHGTNQHVGLPLQNLYQAASNTAIQDNFFIKFTENTKETVEYLVNFSRMLIKMFKSKILASCSKHDIQPVDINDDLVSLITFKELNESSIKNRRMNVTELFVKMLIQIKGISVERALAITQVYPTPTELKRMFQENPGSQGEKLLSGIKYGKNGKTLGILLSKTIYQAFNKTQY